MGMTPQQFHIIPTSCAILPLFAQIYYVFVVCRKGLWKAVSGASSGGCVVHFDVHGE